MGTILDDVYCSAEAVGGINYAFGNMVQIKIRDQLSNSLLFTL